LPFAHRLSGILDMYLPGMLGGEAVADLLFGDATPSGKLAETWPLTAADASSAPDFNRGPVARYAESIYLGYRFHDSAALPVRFPFGHGLSYTTFAYGDLSVEARRGRVRVELDVANTGDRDGAEIVQLYVRNNRGRVFKAEKELRAFTRVAVAAGQIARVRLEFDLADLAYWDVAEHDWVLENGEYELLVAASASDIRLRAPLLVATGRLSRSPYPAEVDAAYATPPRGIPAAFPALLGRPVPEARPSRRLTLETRLGDARHSLLGALFYRAVLGRVTKDYRAALALPDGLERDAKVMNAHFIVRLLPSQSLRSMAMSSAGALPYRIAQGIADLATFHPIRGLRRLLTRG
jgi:beta-glucosidase